MVDLALEGVIFSDHLLFVLMEIIIVMAIDMQTVAKKNIQVLNCKIEKGHSLIVCLLNFDGFGEAKLCTILLVQSYIVHINLHCAPLAG